LWEVGTPAYDFLGGTAAYKQALCSDTAEQTSIVLSKKRFPLIIEHVLRRAKQRLRQKRVELDFRHAKDTQASPSKDE
jgi:hypothetical protein